MITEVGEFIVGAYLKLEFDCDVVDYNVRPPGGGLRGLDELDVVGLDFQNDIAYLCEVTTHIRGLLYGSNQETVKRIKKKHRRQRNYAKKYLSNFKHHRFMFWSPYVPRGYLTESLTKINTLELIINGDYKKAIEKLRARAGKETQDSGNPFFRTLQILENLKDWT